MTRSLRQRTMVPRLLYRNGSRQDRSMAHTMASWNQTDKVYEKYSFYINIKKTSSFKKLHDTNN